MASWFSTRLRRARLEQGLSQEVLAKKVGVSQGTVSNWEKRKGSPNDAERDRLNEIFGGFNKSADAKDTEVNDSQEVAESRAFGNWLRRARENAEMSVHELAEASGVSGVQIYNLETGKSTNPRQMTRKRLEKSLKVAVPDDVQADVEADQSIEGLGPLTDFDPHDRDDRPPCAGVYVFYDVSDRPVYVGKGTSIKGRVADHEEKFWFKYPIVSHGAYLEIKDGKLRHQVEQVLIKFLKSNAVINKQSVQRGD